MLVTVLQAKIRKAVVTASYPSYIGSITIDPLLLEEMGVCEWQVCDVNSMDGFRGTTYIIAGERGSGCIEANGALSLHILKGDIIHINVYALVDAETAKTHKPIIIESNK